LQQKKRAPLPSASSSDAAKKFLSFQYPQKHCFLRGFGGILHEKKQQIDQNFRPFFSINLSPDRI